ncbi:hypothetical protein F511_26495 [Dorcoceras hygrometricum]|uniref:Uncharacterized protein n=1 Tax=Dorcoceras hygrometricum TaxID=472368 RepID=A0A2Z7BH89_9LAMI|nr:hypothetical protein F511_26495 [Dorcoceras hygrometricum]
MTSAVTSSFSRKLQYSAGIYQQMRREVKEMKRRRARESADGLALMTSLVTSSQSADGLSLAVARISRCYLEIAIAKRCRLHKLIRQSFALALKIQQMLFAMKKISRYFSQEKPAGSNSTSRPAKQLTSLRRVIKAGCQLLSSIQMAKTTRSLQKKRTQVLFPVGTLQNTFEREEFCVQRIEFKQRLLYARSAIEEDSRVDWKLVTVKLS